MESYTMKFIVEIIYPEEADDTITTELVRNDKGAVVLFETEDEADAYADANAIGDYDVHDLDEIILPEEG